MTKRSIAIFGWLSAVTICLAPLQLLAQARNVVVKNTPTLYEDDKIKVTVQGCSRKVQDVICQATLTSKNGERAISLNGNNIRLVDTEGNEYRPNSVRLANLVSENNSIGTELVESVPVKASFVFGKIPTNTTKFALLQIPLGGGLSGIAKFRNIIVVDPNAPKPIETTATKPPKSKPSDPITTAIGKETTGGDLSLICPDNTKILYRATSKSYLIYICGGKNPTHYVGLAKDGSQGITLRLRYYDRTQFSADNGITNYTIASNRLIISKNTRVVYQERIQVLQTLPGVPLAEEVTPKAKPKKVNTVEEPKPKLKAKPKKLATVEEPQPKSNPKKVNAEVTTSTTRKPALTTKSTPKIRRRVTTTEPTKSLDSTK